MNRASLLGSVTLLVVGSWFLGSAGLRADVFTSPVLPSPFLSARQTDGKWLVAATWTPLCTSNCPRNGITVSRLLTSGAFDPAFGSDGTATFYVGGSPTPVPPNYRPTALLAQADGGLLVFTYGEIHFDGALKSTALFATVTRLTPSGQVDSSFGGLGTGTAASFSNYFGGFRAAAIQPDGRILAAGQGKGAFVFNFGREAAFDQTMSVSRLNTNGAIDTTFGMGGTASATLTQNLDGEGAVDIVITSTEKILLAGAAGVVQWPGGGKSDAAVVQFSSDGVLDTSFGTNGWAVKSFGSATPSRVNKLLQQTGGRIVAVGDAGTGLVLPGNDVVLLGYQPTGQLDSTFGSGGVVVTDLGGVETATAAVLETWDGISVSAFSTFASQPSVATLIRYNADGSNDLRFGAGGLAPLPSLQNPKSSFSSAVEFLATVANGSLQLLAAGPGDTANALVYTPTPEPTRVPALLGSDFDGDGASDLVVYRPETGEWFLRFSSVGFTYANWAQYAWGLPGDRTMPGDFDGDGRADLAVWRPSDGTWYLRFSTGGFSYAGIRQFQWGLPTDSPISGDFDGDGQADLAVFRPSTGEWFLRLSSAGYAYQTAKTYQWGLPGDMPIPGDFDGDGRTDLAVFRPSTGQWFVRLSSEEFAYPGRQYDFWGLAGDVPFAGDLDGDRRADLLLYRPSTGVWYVRYSVSNYSFVSSASYGWGLQGDVPVPSDIDGDGRLDLVVWRPANGTWYVRGSRVQFDLSQWKSYQWGLGRDLPLGGR